MDATDARDLTAGVALQDLPQGSMVPGKVDGTDAILVRTEEGLFAVGGVCTHYSGNLCDGLLTGNVLRCPLHHSKFDVCTGEAIGAPALNALPCWRVDVVGAKAFVRERIDAPRVRPDPVRGSPRRTIIVGGGGAGLAAAEMLRRQGYDGSLTMVSSEADPPIDRPNLSKDYLAGTAPDDWMPLRPENWYREQQIGLMLNTWVRAIDTQAKRAQLADGTALPYDALLLATGSEPVELAVPGAAAGQVLTLRSFADCRTLAAKASHARSALVIGSSFVGLEVAASLVARGLVVHVVAPDAVPMLRTFGAEIGGFVRELHESRGVVFHLGTTVSGVNGQRVTLANGTRLDVELIVAGVGVRPRLALAESAGLAIDRGVSVDEFLETSVPGIFAAGDIARWPDPHSGERIRVEHWALAQRQGQVAALNMLGRGQQFDSVPFFWSRHYDVAIQYIGHAERWDVVDIDGSPRSRDCSASYRLGGEQRALATIGRDRFSLAVEDGMESATRAASQVDRQLDQALALTFPASDPVAIDRPIA